MPSKLTHFVMDQAVVAPGEKNSKKKLTFDHFRPTHTHTKLTFVSFFFEFFILNLSLIICLILYLLDFPETTPF